jgi:GNAT superfamily N-acetyltransferase
MEVIITGPTSGDPKTCEYILRSVPEWFGIEKAIVEYTRAVESLPTFYAKNENETIGLLSTKFHYPNSAEIYLMAIHREWHRKGIGKQLLEATEEWLINTGVNVLQLKTIGESREMVKYLIRQSLTSR